jgi:hypothetical protein
MKNKVLLIDDLVFKLPPKFNGDIIDALEVFIKYMRVIKKKDGGKPIFPKEGTFVMSEFINDALKEMDETQKKVFGQFLIAEQIDDDKWKTINGE